LVCQLHNSDNRLSISKLPQIKWTVDLDVIPCSDDRYDGCIDDTDEAEEENFKEFHSILQKINKNIETYLTAIDNQYGTQYSPTGKLRLY
jgi:hypothetical protein